MSAKKCNAETVPSSFNQSPKTLTSGDAAALWGNVAKGTEVDFVAAVRSPAMLTSRGARLRAESGAATANEIREERKKVEGDLIANLRG
jgi:hypothetical protein